MMRELLASGDFDRLYVQQQLRLHGQAVTLHASFAARGSSATMRTVAASAAQIERLDLQSLRGMQ